MRVSFWGAAQTVTGSCHLVEAAGRRVLVDCGLLQGSRSLEEENAAPFGFDPAGIDGVLLTHAHLDHCGRLPLLVSRGFRGEVIATAATRDLVEIVLLDAARINEEDAEREARRARRRGRPAPTPLFGVAEAAVAVGRIVGRARYDRALEPIPGVRVTFRDAGHILGSASIVVEEVATGARVVFSGDLGNRGRPLLRDPEPPPPCDVLVVESTYGDRDHRSVAASVDELYDAVEATVAAGGNVIVPTFALERAQEVLWWLREGCETGRLPERLPVYLDSPMAITATEVYRHHPEALAESARSLLEAGRDPYRPPGLVVTRDVEASKRINGVSGAVVLAGSGMCTGGRIRHHLKHNLWRPESAVVFVGFAAEGTLARRIIDGEPEVQILGEPVAVEARIHTINGFSAHADRSELLEWIRAARRPETTAVVHGEPSGGMGALVGALRADGFRVLEPAVGDAVAVRHQSGGPRDWPG